MNTKNNFITKEMFDEYKQDQKNKFKRFVIFVVILCLVISGISSVASYSLGANSVSYTAKDTTWEVENTQDAIDELRDNIGASLVGSIFSYMGTSAPYGYLACDGTEYNISDYPRLANHINKHFGSYNYFGGDGSTTFAVPDLRGEFLRGTGTNSHANQGSGESVGVHQDGTELPNFYGNGISVGISDLNRRGSDDNTHFDYAHPNNSAYFRYMTSGTSDSKFDYITSRPTNTSVLYIIKY